tara:strand:- start:6534 stop:6674 length:141 start_codon:yes stop_codon:yes gene_type:complete
MTKDLEKMERMLTLQAVRHAREPDKYPSQKERWDLLLKKYPKRKKR